MLAKRRLFGALLFMLTLLSSAACAQLNLKPYEVSSASGTEVEILAPEVYLLLHDSPLNGGKLKTALVLLDHGQTVFEQRLPDHTADSENLSYRLFVADANRYGILTTESHSNFIRFRLLEDGALSEGFSVQGDLTGYAALLGWLCNLSWEGGTYAVNRFDWDGLLLASTPVSPLHAATYGGFTVLADKSVAYIAPDIDISQGRYALNHLRVSADGEPLSAVHIPLPSDSSTTYGAFSPDGGMLSYTESHALTEPSQFFLARSDAAGRLLFTKMLKAADINVRVNCPFTRRRLDHALRHGDPNRPKILRRVPAGSGRRREHHCPRHPRFHHPRHVSVQRQTRSARQRIRGRSRLQAPHRRRPL